MAERRTPGLQFRGDTWHIDKVVRGFRICGSTGTSDFREAELVLARRIEEVRQQAIFGIRPKQTFRTAATRYLNEHAHKRSIETDAYAIKDVDAFIGNLSLDRVNWDTMQPWRRARKHLAPSTINRIVAVVRRILVLAARLWRDVTGLTWLESVPLLPTPKPKQRQPHPLDWDEQRLFFSELAAHLEQMALFKVNSGCREQEVCGLKWAWEQKVPGVGSVFVVPGAKVKNTEPRVIVLNDVAQSVVEAQRGKHELYVFVTDEGAAPMDRMHSTGWRMARKRAAKRYEKELGRECPTGFKRIRVHDLKHTFGRRLRSAGVSFEDRQDLLGHKSGRITTHYSAAEIAGLVKAANLVNESRNRHAATLLRVV